MPPSLHLRILIIAFIAAAFGCSRAQVLNPTAGYQAGDFVADSFEVYNENKEKIIFKIPADCHLVIYRYAWTNTGRGIDTQDSIAELEKRITAILDERAFSATRVICLSYDRGAGFDKWAELVRAAPPFKNNARYRVEYYNTNGNNAVEIRLKKLLSKLTIISPSGRILRFSSFISRFDYTRRSSIPTTLKGRLITENEGSSFPLANAQVHLESKMSKDTVASALTNMQGEFEMKFYGSESDYVMRVKPADESTQNIILATQDGREISRFNKTGRDFTYRLLKQEVILLSEIREEDVLLKYEDFNSSKRKELVTAENIYYESGRSDIRSESARTLDKIVSILNKNPAISLEIVSHTDAVGDDASNLKLSEQRAAAVADYLVKKGINPARLKTRGKGETELRNRCKNGVPCSDREHEYNRRTEFIFSKG